MKRISRLRWLSVFFLGSVQGLGAVKVDEAAVMEEYKREIEPIFVNYCFDCHGDGLSKGEFTFDDFKSFERKVANREVWKRVRDHIDFRLMPPPDEFAPGDEDREKLISWIDRAIFPVDLENPDPGHVSLRRLNRTEYENTVNDLLGVRVNVREILPADDSGYGFDNIADVLTLSPLHLERYHEAGRKFLDEALAKEKAPHRAIFPKRDEGVTDEDYLELVIGRFAERAFRRPLEDGEIGRYRYFLERARESGEGVDYAIRQGLEAVLISPSFLFREEPTLGDGSQGKALLDEYSLASRLSYFLWSSMPDERLFDLAKRGELRKNLSLEIKRMLASGKSAAVVDNFVGQWLQLRDMAAVNPDRRRFPEFDHRLASDMKRETEELVKHVMKENLPVRRLLDADFTFINERLAKHYGIEGVTGGEFRRVSLEDHPRRGLLNHGSILTLTSFPTRTSPVLRGKYVLENILNTPPPPPPPNVEELQTDRGEGQRTSLREQLERHRNDPNCSSCHALMDPIGFGLENFDAIGRWRVEEGGRAIEVGDKLATGQKFASAEELREIIVNDYQREFHRALATKLLTYAIGRGLGYYDRPAVDGIVLKAMEDDVRFLSMIEAVVDSVPFQYRRK